MKLQISRMKIEKTLKWPHRTIPFSNLSVFVGPSIELQSRPEISINFARSSMRDSQKREEN